MAQRKIVKVEGEAVWQVWETENGNWIAEWLQFGSVVQAPDRRELEEDIQDAVDLLFQDLLSEGDIEEYLRDRGIEYSLDRVSGTEESDEIPRVFPPVIRMVNRDDTASISY